MSGIVSQPFEPEPTSADDLLLTGLMNYWYLVARAEDVTNKPLALRRLSRNIVVWRGQDGGLNAVEDYCPHRGAPLSLGTVCDGLLTCAYHGLQLDGAGRIVATPPTPESPFVGQKAIKSYPCREIAGAIWVYFGDALHAEAPEPVLPEELTSPDWSHFLFTTEWKCNWQVALDNRLDPVHGSYLHVGTFTLGRGKKETELKVQDTPHGFTTWRTNQRGVNIDWNETFLYPDNVFWVRTEIPYPPHIGGSFRINAHPTPIDKDRTFVWFYRSRQITGWQRDMWRFLYRNRLEARAFEVVDQDRVMLERVSLQARQREMLLQTDIAVARIRRIMKREAERQFTALAEAKSRKERVPA